VRLRQTNGKLLRIDRDSTGTTLTACRSGGNVLNAALCLCPGFANAESPERKFIKNMANLVWGVIVPLGALALTPSTMGFRGLPSGAIR